MPFSWEGKTPAHYNNGGVMVQSHLYNPGEGFYGQSVGSGQYAGAQYRPSALRSAPFVDTAFAGNGVRSAPISPQSTTFENAYRTAPSSPRSLSTALSNFERITGSGTPPPPHHSTSPEAYSLAARAGIAQLPISLSSTFPQPPPPSLPAGPPPLGLGIASASSALNDLPQAMQEAALHTPITSPNQQQHQQLHYFENAPPPTNYHVAPSGLPAAHVNDKIQAAYGLMESALAEMKPHLFEKPTIQAEQQIVALEKAMSEFKDNLLPEGSSNSLSGSTSVPVSPSMTKGEKKRMLPVEGEVAAPPSKRADSAHGSHRKSSFGRMPMPAISHTHSSPVVPSQAHFQAASSMPSFAASMSATPIADATVAGVHVPLSLGGTSNPPLVMPLPRLAPTETALSMSGILQDHSILYSAPLESMQEDVVHSQPTSPRGRQHVTGYFDPMTAGGAGMYDQAVSRQPPNPRTMMQTMIGTPAVSPECTTSGAKAYQTHAPAKSWAYGAMPPRETAYPEPVHTPTARPRSNTVGSAVGRGYDGPASPRDSSELADPHSAASTDTLSPEVREQMDYIFVDWMQSLCNDLEATDAKGEPIHQTLMAKKMQKLDDSGEYRPFRFRIQAFTNRFAEELLARGLREADVPHKLVRIYLWNQPLISRYNEEGKKAKSKGNHVWSIDAKRLSEGRWHFRPFQRRIVSPQAKILREGAFWSWEARIWDPQIQSIRANFSSPSLPPWLAWRKSALNETYSELSGVAPILTQPEDETFTITAIATFEVYGHVQQLETTVDLIITSAHPPNSRPSSASLSQTIASLSQTMPNVVPSHDATPPASLAMDTVTPQQLSLQQPNIDPPPMMPLASPGIINPAQVTIEAMMSPANLLAVEQRTYGETGPLVTALMHQEEAFVALQTLPQNTHPEVVSSYQQQVQRASNAVNDAVSEAQSTALQSLLCPPYPDAQQPMNMMGSAPPPV